MSHKKPQPIGGSAQRDPCPVCGKPSYSAAGIHPQCAANRADKIRKSEIELAKKQRANDSEKATAGRWQKVCPDCDEIQHVRVKQCSCGHRFRKSIGDHNADQNE